jgi:2,4-dienoyl-CoA reductase-like NADH-dependent reductase (Old Yellow Enzyme family)
MTEDEVEETIKEHVHAAKCAVEAGFDCVEIVPLPLQHPTRNPSR